MGIIIYNLNILFVLTQPFLFIDVDSQNGADQWFMCDHVHIQRFVLREPKERRLLTVQWACSDGSNDHDILTMISASRVA